MLWTYRLFVKITRCSGYDAIISPQQHSSLSLNHWCIYNPTLNLPLLFHLHPPHGPAETLRHTGSVMTRRALSPDVEGCCCPKYECTISIFI